MLPGLHMVKAVKRPFEWTWPGTGPPFTLSIATFEPPPDGITVICKFVVAAGFFTELAVMVAVVGAETFAGAIYVAKKWLEKLIEPPPLAGERLHVTPELLTSFKTVPVSES